jgi:hypothetical protein
MRTDVATETEETTTYRFYLGAHLTFITDAEGTVVGLEISPYQEEPVTNDYQEGAAEDAPVEEMEEVRHFAMEKDFAFPALDNLPAGITWEV